MHKLAARRWLWDAADELLASWCPHNDAQAVSGAEGLNWTESSCILDFKRFQRAYDQLLWEIATSPPSELVAFAARFYEEPYINLPPPLRVTVWRLVGLEELGDADRLRAAAAGIAFLCSPTEEA